MHLDYSSRLYACNLAGAIPHHQFRLGVYRHMGQWRIGTDTWVHRGLRLFCLGGVRLGDHSVLNGECWVDGRREVAIGNRVSISIGCKLLTLGHDPQSPDFALQGGPISVGDYAWLGAFSTVLPGVTIGQGAVVGAGALVTKDVPPYAIVAGNPAKVVGQRQQHLDYSPSYAPLFY